MSESGNALPFEGAYMSMVDNLPMLVLRGIPLTEESQKKIFNVSKKHDKVANFQFDLVHLATKDIKQKNIPSVDHGYLNEMYQHSELINNLNSELVNNVTLIFGNKKDDKVFQDFVRSVTSQLQKRFLLIYGHGSGPWSLWDQSWKLGEAQGPVVDINQLMTTLQDESHQMQFKDYSAIVLVSCNTAEKKPPQIHGVPVFYVKGGADFLDMHGEPKVRR